MNWHKRFLQQAGWTQELRRYLFARAGLQQAQRVLEVGCGTGAVLADIPASLACHGLDIDRDRLMEARLYAPQAILACANALHLPYSAGTLDITFCHYLLLWVKDPLRALEEMKRVTRRGGAVLALAEPDHASRLDEPHELIPLGRWQTEALRQQGADPSLGARLGHLFHQAGIRVVETGPITWSRGQKETPEETALEWQVLEADLQGVVPADQVRRMKALDEAARQRGDRVLHVPTFFAYGVV